MTEKLKIAIIPMLLLTFLFSMPNVGGKYWLVPSNVALWLGAGILIAASMILLARKQRIVVSPSHFYLFALLFLLLVSGSIKSELSYSQLSIYYLAFLFVWLFYIALMQYEFSNTDFYRFLFVVVLFGAIQSLIGIIQIYDEQYRLFYLWFGYEPFRIVGGATGSFQQPNMLASFLSLGLMTVFVLFYSQTEYVLTNKKKALLLLSAFLMFFVVLSSGSRAAFVAFIVPFTLFLLVYFKQIYRQPVNFILMLLVFAIAWSVLWYVNGHLSGVDTLANKLVRISEGGDSRIHLYSSAISMFLESPWLGYGIGGYQEAFHAFYAGKELPTGLVESEYQRMTHPHNELLFWMLQSGLTALVAIVAFIYLYMKRMFAVCDKAAIIIILMLPILIQAMLSYPFGLSALHLFLLLILMSFGDQAYKEINLGLVSRFGFAVGAMFLSVVILLSAAKTYQSIYETHYFYNRMFLYDHEDYKGYEERGYFVESTEHPLFKEFVIEAMDKMLDIAIEQENAYDIQQYAAWCNQHNMQNSKNCQIASKMTPR